MTAEVVTALAPGNTNTGAFRARAFQFTLNEPEKYTALATELKSLKTMDYLISCRERAPTTGHDHIHIYVHFSQTYKLSKKILSFGAHIEICRGSPKQNIDYIEKDKNIIETYGEPPHQGSRSIKELKNMDIEDVQPQYYRIKKELDQEDERNQCFNDMLNEIR